MRHNAEWRQDLAVLTGPELAELPPEEQARYLEQQQAQGRYPTRLRLEVDGQVLLEASYRAVGLRQEGSAFAYEQFVLPAGPHQLRLSFDDAGGELAPVLEQAVDLADGQVLTLTFDPIAKQFVLQ
jgi:hypothetical protein